MRPRYIRNSGPSTEMYAIADKKTPAASPIGVGGGRKPLYRRKVEARMNVSEYKKALAAMTSAQKEQVLKAVRVLTAEKSAPG